MDKAEQLLEQFSQEHKDLVKKYAELGRELSQSDRQEGQKFYELMTLAIADMMVTMVAVMPVVAQLAMMHTIMQMYEDKAVGNIEAA